MTTLALVRDVSPAIVHCELTHLSRTPIEFGKAAAQHREYVAALEAAGCRVEHLPVEPELADAVFVEDTAVVLDELAVIARPGALSRRAEVESVAAALVRYRSLTRIAAPGTLDGGDVLRTGRTLYAGLTPRTNKQGIARLALMVEPIGYRVRPVQVSGCLHLKSAVTALDLQTLLINPAWTNPETFAGFTLIEVDPDEPFAANALAVGGVVIHAREFPRTRERIKKAGFQVRPVAASELAKAEGGVTCCSLILEET